MAGVGRQQGTRPICQQLSSDVAGLWSDTGEYPELKAELPSAVNVWLSYIYEDFGALEHDLKDIMVWALGHNVQRATFTSGKEQPLAYLCQSTARASRIRYPFDMIKKLHEAPELKYLSKHDRWDAFKDTFQVYDGYNRRTFKRFWFIDGVITNRNNCKKSVEGSIEGLSRYKH